MTYGVRVSSSGGPSIVDLDGADVPPVGESRGAELVQRVGRRAPTWRPERAHDGNVGVAPSVDGQAGGVRGGKEGCDGRGSGHGEGLGPVARGPARDQRGR